MALNYLQRVAGAAARTTAQAKPAATGPPRMPGIPGPPVQPFASPDHHISEADSTWDPIDSTTAVPPAPPAFDTAEPQEAKAGPFAPPTAASEHRPAESTPSRFESLLRPPAEVIRTPPGLRSLARSNPDRTMQPAPPPPLPANLEGRPEAAQGAASSDIRPARTPQAEVTTATPAQPAHLPSAPAVAPKPQPAAALPNSRTGKAESRIQIGRVEVQVNNTRPARPAPQTAPAASPASDSLAARYLGRFTLRP